MKIQIAIVSDQPLANLIPALMYRPERILLISSDGMTARGVTKHLESILKSEGFAVDVEGGAPDVNMREIYAFAEKVYDRLNERHPNAELVFNATGGKKLMSIGFTEVLRGIATQIIYTDTEHGQIEFLPGKGITPQEPSRMTDVLNVRRYLSAQSLNCLGSQSDNPEYLATLQSRKSAAKFLAMNAEKLDKFFPTMNWLADNALKKSDNREEVLADPLQKLNCPPDRNSIWADALRELKKAKCIGWTEGECEIGFVSAEGARFVRGGWLEEYAFHVLRDEKPFDVRLGTRVVSKRGEKAENEFDVLACNSNQLLFVECKTLKFTEGKNDNDTAYKIKSLGDVARGLFGETWLLTAQKPTELLIERSRQARFRLIGPSELPKLRNLVREWLRK